MAALETCVACSAPLTQQDERLWRCANPNCPTGGQLQRCGYCRHLSLATSAGVTECFNSDCKMHQMKLSGCPKCRFYSFMAVDWRDDFCINRKCSGNAEIVQTCEFCGHRSFLRDDGIDFCSKGDCRALVQRMRECSFCKKWMVDCASNKCLNSNCAHFDEQMIECGSCGKREYSLEGDRCFNDDCTSNVATVDVDTPLPSPPAATLDPMPDMTIPIMRPADPPPPAASEPKTPGGGFSPPPGESAAPTAPARDHPPGTPSLAIDDGLMSIRDAFQVVRSGLLADEGSTSYCPLLLVMGTAGAGKTAYLAALGKILRERTASFHFPHPGVKAQPIDYDRLADLLLRDNPASDHQQLKTQTKAIIEDLVFKYAEEAFDGYIAKGIWCEFTRRDSGQFLVANITKRGQPVANIVTLETSGENFVELLKGINDLAELEQTGGPIVAVMAEMLLHAQGLIVLMDPSESENDQTYRQFFDHLTRHLANRVHRVLHEEIRERMATESDDESRRQKAAGGLAVSERHASKALVEAAASELSRLTDDLNMYGYEAVERAHYRFRRVMTAVSRQDGEKAGAFQLELDNLAGDPRAQAKAWMKVMDLARSDPQNFAKVMFAELGPTTGGKPLTIQQRIAREICFARGIHENTVDDFDLKAGPSNFRDHLPHLRDIALVFSKTDMYPVVHPPTAFPRLKLPSSVEMIESIENYLRFLGGEVRYYNSSVLGYSTSANGQYFPGAEASLTPVNVIEPLFDMLGDVLKPS